MLGRKIARNRTSAAVLTVPMRNSPMNGMSSNAVAIAPPLAMPKLPKAEYK